MTEKGFFSVRARFVSAGRMMPGADCVYTGVFIKDGSLFSDLGVGLDELLSRGGRFILNITDPSRGCLDALCSLAGRDSIVSRVLVASPHADVLKRVRASIPACATALTPVEALAVLLLSKAGLLFLRRRFAGDALVLSESAFGVRLLNAQLAKELRERGVRIFAWGVSDPVRACRLLDAGIEGVISDDEKAFKTTV